MLVRWQKNLELGHPAADAEHREVVDLLNKVETLVTVGAPPASMDRTLAALVRALCVHLQPHKEAAAMVEQARRLHRQWRDAGSVPQHDDLQALAQWWLRHVCSHSQARSPSR